MIKYIILLIFIPSLLFAEVLFEDNFDDQADWVGEQQSSPNDITCPGGSGCNTLPSGWSQARIASERPCSNTDGNHDTMIIDSTNRRGSSGKGFTYWSEDCLSHDDSWASDGLLSVLLSNDQQELYIRFWIKFQSDWEWDYINDNYVSQKFLHLTHKGETDGWYQFFSDTENKPRAFFNFSFYDNSSTTNYASLLSWYDNGDSFAINDTEGSWSAAGKVGDGDWHRLDFHVKNNSAADVLDGEWHVWMDGILVSSKTDVNWIGSGSVSSRGWNTIHLGGNNYNLDLQTNTTEQWYAIDDVVISNTEIPSDYVIGSTGNTQLGSGTPVDISDPTAPSVVLF